MVMSFTTVLASFTTQPSAGTGAVNAFFIAAGVSATRHTQTSGFSADARPCSGEQLGNKAVMKEQRTYVLAAPPCLFKSA